MSESDISGYGYGIWLVSKNQSSQPFNTRHIPHITLVCNILEKRKAECLYRHIKPKVPELIQVQIHTNAVIFEDPYSENDPYPQSWGYYCKLLNERKGKVIYWLRTIMQEHAIKGSISHNLHITMEYQQYKDQTKHPPNLSKDIHMECEVVIADITKPNAESWSILDST